MKVLIITENDDICCMTDYIIKSKKTIDRHSTNEELSYMDDNQYDIIIVDCDKTRIQKGDFKIIFDIRCKTQTPILVILDGGRTRDKLHILKIKADDYIERPIDTDKLEEKIVQLLH